MESNSSRTRGRQTLTSQQAGQSLLVDNPKQIIQRRHRQTGVQQGEQNLNADPLGFAPPMLGSPLDVEPNPFLADTTDPSAPVASGRLRLSILAAIPEEPLGEDDLEATQQQTDDSLLSPPPRSDTPTPAATTVPTNMPSKMQMPTPLSPSTPKWDGQTKALRNFLRIVEQLFKLSEITDSRQKLDWLLSYVEADTADQWASFPEYGAGS